MTVIACRNGVMAADTAVWQGEIIVGHRNKIIRLFDDSLLAAAGDSSLAGVCRDWLNGDHRPQPVGELDFAALWLRPTGLFRIDHRFFAFPDLGEFAAEGAHDEFVLGAMAAGASAEEAVGLAIKYCRRAGGGVHTKRLKEEA
jgi:hypothetical protein